ncbi:uncharacterized protein MELLADRAFT_90784 [Melampsora larici-populina 98AG31]|uniref:Uncharacterized protein n=1 Tax=Melampsora larici-populina (strain 98AG31 / pathotype 3-4-7) TaxID=747676 RepID=F4R7G9_MELLP|nr:uncharacterized protein MELLADRAFT_90784 [Melampsora larici-populina 98AG31]EGG11314.1 hypothetical protein MELLADRAFT_90784 [Melampsora larici-populina 98AG31]
MPRKSKKEMAEEEEARKRDFAWRRARQAGREGLSPDVGRTGTPYYFDKPGYHWENGRYGKRQYRDTDLVHVDPFAEPGFREFACPFNVHPEINVDAGIVPMVFPVGHQGFEFPIPAVEEHHHGVLNVVHRDPTFGGQALGCQGSIVIASKTDIDPSRSTCQCGFDCFAKSSSASDSKF